MAANHNLLKPADGSPILHIEQDIVFGCYFLTYQKPGHEDDETKKFSSIEEALMLFDKEELTLQSKVENSNSVAPTDQQHLEEFYSMKFSLKISHSKTIL
jgi:DNA-directed RNA polymerase beta' subunit